MTSTRAAIIYLRVLINDRARIFRLQPVIWPASKAAHPLLIGETTALRTGLTLFVHDNATRTALLGLPAFSSIVDNDPTAVPPSIVASIGKPDDDELLERISPIEGYRAAMLPPTPTDDPLVNEFMADPDIGPVFGPLPKEPANVPPFDFDLNIEAVSKMTYGSTQTIKLGPSSTRGRDVLDAHFSELYEANIMAPAFPNVAPQPIASVAFTVPKPGVSRPPRPPHFNLPTASLTPEQRAANTAYAASLTADRLVINHQALNEVMVIQHYPVPSVQEHLLKLSSFKLFAKIDITKAYWSIGLSERCQKYTYTIAPGGHAAYWLRAPMGCSAVGGYFQWALDGVLREERAFTAIYADDIQVGANSPEELKRRIRQILLKLLNAGFRVSAKKCQFQPSNTITYLGWVINNGTVSPSPSTLDKLWKVKKPCDLRGKDDAKRKLLQRFLGLVNYLAHYLPFSAEQLRPLHNLTKTKHEAPFVWSAEADAAWDAVINKMRDIQPLHTPTYAEGSWLEVFSDASSSAWGGILVERRVNDPVPYLVYCVSGSFSDSQLYWPTIQQEVYGAWATVRRLRSFLWNVPFVLNMDHRNLLWSAQSVNPLVQRLATDLQTYRFVMKHVAGDSHNIVADYISRADYLDEPPPPQQHPSCASITPHPLSSTPPHPTATPSPTVAQTLTDSSLFFGSNYFSDSNCSALSSDSETEGTSDLDDPPTLRSPRTAGRGLVMPISLPLPDVAHNHAPPPPPPPLPSGAPHIPAPLQPPSPSPSDASPPRQRRRRLPRYAHPPLNADDGGPLPFLQDQPSAETSNAITMEHYHILKTFHGLPLAHTGVDPMMRALEDAGHSWPSMRADVTSFISTCHHCQMERLSRREPFPLPYHSLHSPSSLFDTLHLDIIGPFPQCSLSGSRYIMIAVDEASKFHFLGHSVDCSTSELMCFLLDCFKLVGIPRTIKSDRGAAFISRAVREFCDATGIEHKFGIAHNHQSDGTIENSARLVNSYLRVMVHELRKYAAWSPLLCNVMLSVNSLRREVLAGACANDLVFGRRIRPIRFLRPSALRRPGNPSPDDPPAPASLNTFLADNAALQLQLLAAADDTRWKRIATNSLPPCDDQQHLDWTRVGALVSIPQPEHESRLRPGKFDLRRRGPYEIVDCDTNTVTLRDYRAFVQLQRPVPFRWPKRWLWPYHMATFPAPSDAPAQPDGPPPPPLPRPALSTPIDAVIASRPLQPPIAPVAPSHVANHEYLCRWPDRPHTANAWMRYKDVWSSTAFNDFLRGSDLTGHVPPTTYLALHRQHLMALAHNHPEIPRDVAIDHPAEALQLLQDYVPLESAATAPKRQIQLSSNQFNFLHNDQQPEIPDAPILATVPADAASLTALPSHPPTPEQPLAPTPLEPQLPQQPEQPLHQSLSPQHLANPAPVEAVPIAHVAQQTPQLQPPPTITTPRRSTRESHAPTRPNL